MKIKSKSLLWLLIILVCFPVPLTQCKTNTEYSLGIKKNATYEWKVTFVHDNVHQLLEHQTVGLIFDLGFKVKVIVKEIDNWSKIWQIWCEEYPNYYDSYYYKNYVVWKSPTEETRDINLNIKAQYASIFGGKPVETYLTECSAKNPGLNSNGTTIISYIKLDSSSLNPWIQGDETDYLYRAEGEYNKNSGVLRTVKYYLNTDELLFQWDLLSPSIGGMTLILMIIAIGSVICIIARQEKKKENKFMSSLIF
ncbi:MAG: hypothetical protein ACFFCI_07900 [Promethearchaeota archaeon]